MAAEYQQSYEVESIQRADAPAGGEGSAWCRYVIKQGNNTIRGYRQGSLKTVSAEIKELVKQLNDRRSGKRAVPVQKKRTRH